MSIIAVTTAKGFVYEVDEEALDDIELVEELVEMETKDGSKAGSVARRVLGEEGKKKLYEDLRTESGRVPLSEVVKTIYEILTALQNGKK